jgi:methylated-DNA-[protein]-cysteine S-methyltransferase
MTGQYFAIFDTAIGPCGIVWGERGITGVQLPMGDEEKTRNRIHQRDGDATEAAPSAEVQHVLAEIIDLING